MTFCMLASLLIQFDNGILPLLIINNWHQQIQKQSSQYVAVMPWSLMSNSQDAQTPFQSGCRTYFPISQNLQNSCWNWSSTFAELRKYDLKKIVPCLLFCWLRKYGFSPPEFSHQSACVQTMNLSLSSILSFDRNPSISLLTILNIILHCCFGDKSKYNNKRFQYIGHSCPVLIGHFENFYQFNMCA